MDNFLYVAAVICFALLIYILIPSKKQKKGSDYVETVNSLDVSSKEFFKVLNFMLLYGIIDFDQYNELEKKALSYVR